MTVFTNILVPIDFGEPANHALEVATLLAKKLGSKLTLVHASQPPPGAHPDLYAENLYWPPDEAGRDAKRTFDEALSRVRAAYPNVEGVIALGEPAQAILDLAKKRGADLIVMGTHGRRGLSRLLIGSVAAKVVRLSVIPVMTVAASMHASKESAPAASPNSK